LAKIKIDFIDFLGVGCAGWQCHSFFLYTAVPFLFFENIFLGQNSGLFDDLVESTLLAGEKSKKKRREFRGFSSKTG